MQGTLQYMAPEQASRKVVNDRTDLYNFGATMYRIDDRTSCQCGRGCRMSWTGHLEEPEPAQATRQYNPNLPRQLNDLIMSCVETDPEARPATIHVVRERLGEVAAKLGLDPGESRPRHAA